MQTEKETGMSKPTAFALGVVLVLIVGIGGLFLFTKISVRNLSQNDLVLKLSDIFGLAAATVNGQEIPYSKYAEEFAVLDFFYSRNAADFPDQTSETISDQVLSRWMNNLIIEQEAKKFAITVEDSQVEEARNELLANFESESAAREKILENYGWDLEKYVERILEPLVLAANVEEYLQSDEADLEGFEMEEIRASHILFTVEEGDDADEVRAQAEEVLQEIKDGADFAEMAAEYGSDGTKDMGGDLGWFALGDMVAEFEVAVFALEPGQLSDTLVETQYGYHIVKATDKRMAADYQSYVDNLFETAQVEILIPVHNPFETAEG